jgi:hypothetical protein
MISSFFNNSRPSINLLLRARILGPYKLNSPKKIFTGIKYLVNFMRGVNLNIMWRQRRASPEQILMELRNKKIVSYGDYSKIYSILSNNNFKRVIVFTTLNDPILFDLVKACDNLNIQTDVFIDCWDNISTSPAIPEGISNLYLWSKQQFDEISLSYPNLKEHSKILGSYRFPKTIISNNSLSNNFNPSKLSILYLESSIFEDRYFIINQIINSFLKVKIMGTNIKHLNITIRRYPGKRPLEMDFLDVDKMLGTFERDGTKITIKLSSEKNLHSDFNETNIVFSELTTAALEAGSKNIFTIFVMSNRSPRYISTLKSFSYSFTHNLEQYFYILNLGNRNSVTLLSKILQNFVVNLQISGGKTHFLLNNNKNLDYFLQEFNWEKWQKLSQ